MSGFNSEAVLISTGSNQPDWNTMVKRIEQEIHRAGYTDQIQVAMISAMDYYKYESFWFNEATHEFDLTVDQQSYETEDGVDVTDGLPSDYLSIIRHPYILVGGTRWLEMEMVDIDRVRWLTPTDTVVGVPTHYAIWNEAIYFTPIPNEVGTSIRMEYIRDLGVPWYRWDGTAWQFYLPGTQVNLAGTFTSRWLNEAEELIRSRAKWDIYNTYLDDEENISKMEVATAVAHGKLKQKYNAYKRAVRREPTFV